jgi:hypothetical protein
MKGYDNHAYIFRASDWTTGDANRVAASNITYDEQQNILHVKATGLNNVALMMKYQDLDYTIDAAQKYLVVRGSNLDTTGSGKSYLWWLNGSNHGTQVAPATTRTITLDGVEQKVIAWNMSTSGLYENFSGDRPSVCMGQTIFGLTSTTGQTDIYDINFIEDVNAYVSTTTSVGGITRSPGFERGVYDLQGRSAHAAQQGFQVRSGRVVISQ